MGTGARDEEFWASQNSGMCRRCGWWKPRVMQQLCEGCQAAVEAALSNVDDYEGTQRPRAVWPPAEERR